MGPDDTKQTASDDPQNPAANVIRSKIDRLYADEPDTGEETLEAIEAGKHRTKHQDFMYKLSTSGKSLAEIQTQWHNYYVNLPDHEKHEVWQEFYAAHQNGTHALKSPDTSQTPPAGEHDHNQHPHAKHQARAKPRTAADVKNHLLGKIGARGKLSRKHHIQSLLFGLGSGAFVLVFVLFGFFNERFVAPFITPSRSVSSTPIIIDPNSTTSSAGTQIVIPKINVEIPVVYDQASTEEKEIQKSLEQGVVHYATTPNPGQKGNSVIVGHSSNNIFNQGKYKFAFVLLSRLEQGDIFYLTKDGTRYAYKIYDKRIIKPTDVSVLGPADKVATATLITCDPPGTSLNRLIVVGEQITPDPNKNAESTAVKVEGEPGILPSNAPSLWQRLKDWVAS